MIINRDIIEKGQKSMDPLLIIQRVVHEELPEINPHFFPVLDLMKKSGPFMNGYIINTVLYKGISAFMELDNMMHRQLKDKIEEAFDNERNERIIRVKPNAVKSELLKVKAELSKLMTDIDNELNKYPK